MPTPAPTISAPGARQALEEVAAHLGDLRPEYIADGARGERLDLIVPGAETTTVSVQPMADGPETVLGVFDFTTDETVYAVTATARVSTPEPGDLMRVIAIGPQAAAGAARGVLAEFAARAVPDPDPYP